MAGITERLRHWSDHLESRLTLEDVTTRQTIELLREAARRLEGSRALAMELEQAAWSRSWSRLRRARAAFAEATGTEAITGKLTARLADEDTGTTGRDR